MRKHDYCFKWQELHSYSAQAVPPTSTSAQSTPVPVPALDPRLPWENVIKNTTVCHTDAAAAVMDTFDDVA